MQDPDFTEDAEDKITRALVEALVVPATIKRWYLVIEYATENNPKIEATIGSRDSSVIDYLGLLEYGMILNRMAVAQP